jgi:hypothetical protein
MVWSATGAVTAQMIENREIVWYLAHQNLIDRAVSNRLPPLPTEPNVAVAVHSPIAKPAWCA